MPESAKLLAEIEAFLAQFDVAPTTFGREALGDSAFVKRLRDDPARDMKLSTIERARTWMESERKRQRLERKPKARKPRKSRAQQICAA